MKLSLALAPLSSFALTAWGALALAVAWARGVGQGLGLGSVFNGGRRDGVGTGDEEGICVAALHGACSACSGGSPEEGFGGYLGIGVGTLALPG